MIQFNMPWEFGFPLILKYVQLLHIAQLCEWIHAVTNNMLTKLADQWPRTSLNILLTKANMAHNLLQMWHGYYGSYQLVFGTNPNLPNIMTDNLLVTKCNNKRNTSKTFVIFTWISQKIYYLIRSRWTYQTSITT